MNTSLQGSVIINSIETNIIGFPIIQRVFYGSSQASYSFIPTRQGYERFLFVGNLNQSPFGGSQNVVVARSRLTLLT